jgi:CheY-like chemotaxis protein
VRLPLATEAAEVETPLPPPAVIPPARVLVIDDDPAVRAVLTAMLEDAGHQAVAAADGQEGLERCVAGSVDLVLTDVSMPKLSGWDVAAACRERFALVLGKETG